jgi:hypothetical protein
MRRSALALACLVSACASAPPEPRTTDAKESALCDAYGVRRGTPAYAQCATEVDKAMWRAARSRSRVNCTPMGNQTVCQ